MSSVSATSTLSLFSWIRSKALSRFSQNEISYGFQKLLNDPDGKFSGKNLLKDLNALNI
jgi:hypothetical protein